MRILVTTKHLRLDRTAEGILASKCIRALHHGGHELACVTGDDIVPPSESPFTVPWLPSVPIYHLDASRPGSGGATRDRYARLSEPGGARAYAARRLNSAVAYSTGHGLAVWREVSRWQAAISEAVERFRPDILFVRGAGISFEPHMAMLRWRSPVPWIANYHDPYPISLYPEPQCFRTPLVSHWQEAIHRRILARADALAFPCERLMQWVLQGRLQRYREKSFLLPHVASGGFETPTEGDPEQSRLPHLRTDQFWIVHTGSLVNGRDPWALLRGFKDFLASDPQKRSRARLLMVGRVARQFRGDPLWKELTGAEQVTVHEERVDHQRILALAESATAVALVDVNGAISPIFLAKLADYLWLRKPILALTPLQSGTRDILGADYPLLTTPTDPTSVRRALDLLWDHWLSGDLERLQPRREVIETISEERLCRNMDAIREFIRPGGRHGQPLQTFPGVERSPRADAHTLVTRDGGAHS